MQNMATGNRENAPLHAHIEPTSLCNLHCPTCYNEFLPAKRRGNLSFENYMRLIANLPTVNDVSLLGLGEPFINPELLLMAEEAKSRGITVRTATNATLIGRYDPVRTLSAFDEIIFSIDAADADIFAHMRKGADLAVVLNNIATLAATRKRKGLATLLTTNTVLSQENRDQIPGLIKLAKSMGMAKMRFVMAGDLASRKEPIMQFHRKRLLTMRIESADIEQSLAGEVKALGSAYGIPTSFAGSAPYAPDCWWPLRGAYISYDGGVTPCCMRMDPDDYGFGNALEKPMLEIWNSPAYARFRREMAAGGVPEVCKGCP